ncbi:MAG: protein-export chaperone SecB [Alphaproteobacteria bacterium]|nr:protein-export chaperone SecB [Alphaproteobacteria bacterium]
MAEATPKPEAQAGLQIMVQYVRDLSFENPGAPNFAAGQNPEIGVNANVGARKLSDTDYEVGLKFRIEAKSPAEGTGESEGDGEESLQFIAELEYCGVFRLMNIPEADIKPVLLIEAPRQLFPFARRVLADATRDGGYPPIMLDPIDFMALYQQSESSQAEDAGETLN